jgi:alpha-glucosidase
MVVPTALLLWPLLALADSSSVQQPLANCPGYTVTNVQEQSNGLIADLTLAGSSCDTYGADIVNLKLKVDYQTGELIILVHQDMV